MKKSLCILLSLILAFSVAGVGATTAFADGGKKYVLREEDLEYPDTTPNDGLVAARITVENEDDSITVTKGTILQPGDSIVICNQRTSERRGITISYVPYDATDEATYIDYIGLPTENYTFKDEVAFQKGVREYTILNIGENTAYATAKGGVEQSGEFPIDYTMQYHVFKGWEVISCIVGGKAVTVNVAAVWEEDPNNPIPSDEPIVKTPFEEFIDKVKGYLVLGINVMILLLQGIVEYLETGEISIIKGLLGGGEGGEEPAVTAFLR